jgi:hypothetical protein
MLYVKLTSMFLCNMYKDCTNIYKMWKISCSPFSLRICVNGRPVAIDLYSVSTWLELSGTRCNRFPMFFLQSLQINMITVNWKICYTLCSQLAWFVIYKRLLQFAIKHGPICYILWYKPSIIWLSPTRFGISLHHN